MAIKGNAWTVDGTD